MDAEMCPKVDWQRIGFIDGQHGRPDYFVNEHKTACDAGNIQVLEAEYEEGRQKGLLEYCTLDGAFRAGARGEAYRGVCPKEFEAQFLEQNRAGLEVASLKRERKAVRDELERRQEKIAKDRSVLGDISKAYYLVSGKSPTAELDDRDERLSDEIFKRESKSPAGSLSMEPETNTSGIVSAIGSFYGTVIGFGLGHLIQSRYVDDGAKWTAIDASFIASIGVIAHNCPSNVKSDSHVKFGDAAFTDSTCSVLGPLWFVSFIGARVWQSVDLIRHTRRALSPYSEPARMSLVPKYIAPMPVASTLGVGAEWSF